LNAAKVSSLFMPATAIDAAPSFVLQLIERAMGRLVWSA